MPLKFSISTKERGKRDAQLQRLILDGFETAVRTKRHVLASPMKSTANTIVKILQGNLNVTTYKSTSAGYASGLLHNTIGVKMYKEYFTVGGMEETFPRSDFAVVLPFEIDIQEYGYAIGEPDGYQFSANYQQIAKWIISRNYVGFYYISGGKQRPVSTEKGAERAAYMIMKSLTGKKNVVLPDWYKLKDEDWKRLTPRIRSSVNLLMKEVRVHFDKITK